MFLVEKLLRLVLMASPGRSLLEGGRLNCLKGRAVARPLEKLVLLQKLEMSGVLAKNPVELGNLKLDASLAQGKRDLKLLSADIMPC
mmetsp:Transcript_40401/g.72573  ORF Transcript_40401/g.72573 Transcript_40401/m.72573 type:complete len:87 (-) Transcript_40401:60-320(-)